MKSSLLTIGDELLIGQVLDTNAPWLAEKLYLLGAPVIKKMTVGDDVKAIKAAIKQLLNESDIVIMTGGLGPTKDDVTVSALAETLNRELIFDQDLFRRLKRIFFSRNIPMTEAHHRQCFLPEGAVLLNNSLGTAPGLWFQIGKIILIALPGISVEMKGIMEDEIIPKLQKMVKPLYKHITFHTSGCPESTLAKLIDPVLAPHQPGIKIAYLPSSGEVRVRLSAKGSEDRSADDLIDHGKSLLLKTIGRHIYSYNGKSLAEVIGEELKRKSLTLSIAESCTGGFIAQRITSIAGASDYFLGSVTAYSNTTKKNLLGVSGKTLELNGAVSEPVVCEMAAGVIRLMSSDIGVAVSGIAGPGGGSDEKPVGTIWIAVGDKYRMISKNYLFGRDRNLNIQLAGNYALTLLRRFLIEQ